MTAMDENPSDENLGETFGPAAVTTRLAGRLPRVTHSTSPVADPVARPVARPVAASAAQPVAPPPVQPVAQVSTSGEDTGTKQITVYVRPHVPAAIRADKAGRTNATVVYNAIEGCQDQLPALLAARHSPPATANTLFAHQPGDRAGEQRVPWTFKATPANRAVLDRLATRFAATSRSELISVALEAAYPTPPALQG